MSQENTYSKEPDLALAPHAPRALAAFIDYLALWIVALVLSQGGLPTDLHIWISTLCATIYYGLGNSSLASGQTIGKKLMGLQVLSTKEHPHYTPKLSQSISRYILAFGLVALASELPRIYFRSVGLVASSWILDFHMLLVLCYCAANFSAILWDKRHRALHDYFCGTIVVYLRGGEKQSETSETSKLRSSPFIAASATGLLLSLVLWLPGVLYSKNSEEVMRHRYRIEKDLGLRLLSVREAGKVTSLDFLVEKTTQSEFNSIEELSRELKQYLGETAFNLPSFELSFYLTQGPWNPDSPMKIVNRGAKAN